MKIAIVNDLPLAVESLRRAVTAPNTLAWVAKDGAEAVRRCAADRPDLVLMDLIMPGMDGVEATRLIMAQSPCAILLVTANAAMTGKVYEAMGAGALDVVAPPTLHDGAAEFLAKIDMIGRLLGVLTTHKTPAKPRVRTSAERAGAPLERLVAIGSSAGGPAALATVLGSLPPDFPGAIVIVQHVDEKFAAGLAEWLNDQTALPVRLAQTGDRPQAGVVLLAGTGDHLVFMAPTILGYTPRPIECAYRPSVDVFFESAGRFWRGSLLGVLLTGMGCDGARGLKTLRNKGCHTIAQDQASSAIYGMPKHAAAIGAAVEILPLAQVAPALEKFAFAQPGGIRLRHSL